MQNEGFSMLLHPFGTEDNEFLKDLSEIIV